MRIAIVAAYADVHGTFTPGKAFMTGTTTALIEQARWAKKNGHDVTWIGNCDDVVWEGVKFVGDLRKATTRGEAWDIAIMHGMSTVPDFPAAVKIVDCQVFYPPTNLKAKWVDSVQCHSDFQRDGLCNTGVIDLDRSYVIPNGYDKNTFKPTAERPTNEEKVFVYTSSPDRGLHHIFPIMDLLAEKGLPFSLHVFYNVTSVVKGYWYAMDILGLRAHAIEAGMKRPYVVYHGPVSQEELADWYRKADLLVYPCDPVVITETFCTTIVEALACGCIPLISDVDVLPMYEAVAPMLPLPINYDAWASSIMELLADKEGNEKRRLLGYEFAKAFRWYRIAPRWEAAYKKLWEQKMKGV